MKRGDRVYVAGFDYGGDVEIAALTVKSVGASITVTERCSVLNFAARVASERLASSRLGALEHLVARAELQERAAMAALSKATERRNKVQAILDKARQEGLTP